MSKKKNKLREIKDALLSNASYIKNTEETVVQEIAVVPENAVEIEKSVYNKLKLLANYYKKEPSDLVNDAISHFLRLKRLDIEEALKNIVVGDDED